MSSASKKRESYSIRANWKYTSNLEQVRTHKYIQESVSYGQFRLYYVKKVNI